MTAEQSFDVKFEQWCPPVGYSLCGCPMYIPDPNAKYAVIVLHRMERHPEFEAA